MQEKEKNVPFQTHFFLNRVRDDSVTPYLINEKSKPREFFLFNPHRVEEFSGSRIKDITLYICSKDYILG